MKSELKKCKNCNNHAMMGDLCYPHYYATRPQMIKCMDIVEDKPVGYHARVSNSVLLQLNGYPAMLSVKERIVAGILLVEDNQIFLLHNDGRLCGGKPKRKNRRYTGSWFIGSTNSDEQFCDWIDVEGLVEIDGIVKTVEQWDDFDRLIRRTLARITV